MSVPNCPGEPPHIRKHTGATQVRVWPAANQDGVTLNVEDTGDGFEVEKARKRGGLGLISMEERARLVNGKFSIRSQPGNGTSVEVFVPLEGKAEMKRLRILLAHYHAVVLKAAPDPGPAAV